MQKKSTLGRKVIYGAIIVTGLYLVLCVALTLAQRRLLYFPCKRSLASSEKIAAENGFQIWRNTTGQFIGWKLMATTTPARGQILILHGNAGCALGRAQYAVDLQTIAPLDVYILEYPGYDGRPGSPSQKSLFAAATEGITLLSNQCDVLLIGESLGTGVAAYLAGNNQVSGVCLISPYNNLTAVARHHLPIFPVRIMLRDKFPSEDYLKSYHGPLAVLLAGKDTTVPTEFGRKLYDGYDGPKKLWESPEASHIDVSQPKAQFWKEVLEFWQKPAQR